MDKSAFTPMGGRAFGREQVLALIDQINAAAVEGKGVQMWPVDHQYTGDHRSEGANLDLHAISSSLAQLANLVHEAKCLSRLGLQDDRGGAPGESVQNVIVSLRTALDNLSGKLDIVLQALNGFQDSVERLTLAKTPIILVEEEARERSACAPLSGEKYRHGGTANVADGVNVNIDRKRTDGIE
jgi:hypothetical protein